MVMFDVCLCLILYVRLVRNVVQKKIMENSFTVGGWGQDWTEFLFVGLIDGWIERHLAFYAFLCLYVEMRDMGIWRIEDMGIWRYGDMRIWKCELKIF